MESIMSILGLEDSEERRKKRLFALAMQLERASVDGLTVLKPETVEIARAIRDLLVSDTAKLESSEKTHIFKIMNRAKVRALQTGHSEGYNIFQALDSISADVNPFF